MTTIFLVALAGVVVSLITGSLWYSSVTPMGRLHMRSIGFDKLSSEEQKTRIEAEKPRMWKRYLAQSALSLLNSFVVVTIVTFSMQNGLPFSMAVGFVALNWLCFMVPVVGTSVVWGTQEGARAWMKFLSDAAYYFVTVLLIAVLASFFV